MVSLLKFNTPRKLYQTLIHKRFITLDDTPPTPPHLASTRYTKQETLPTAKYGGRFLVTMIPGDGIGEELMCHVREVFKMICAPIDFEVIDFDEPPDIDYIIHSTRRNQCAIKGHMERWYDHTDLATFDSPNVALRKRLDLFAYVNEFRSYKNVRCKAPDLDIALVRQNTEGEYSMLEHETVKGVVNSLKIHTRTNATKIAAFAIDYAKCRNRKKITIVHKANIMKKTDGLFLEVCTDVMKDCGIEVNSIIVDNACMQLVTDPHQFDMILTPNLYGNILSNVICGLIGGPGIIAASNYGDHCAVFEPACRNRAMSMKYANEANPTAFLSAGVYLLSHLRFHSRADLVKEALRATIEDDHMTTKDLGGTCTTDHFMAGLKENLCSMMCTGEDGEIYCPSFCEDDPIEINLEDVDKHDSKPVAIGAECTEDEVSIKSHSN